MGHFHPGVIWKLVGLPADIKKGLVLTETRSPQYCWIGSPNARYCHYTRINRPGDIKCPVPFGARILHVPI